MPTCGIYAIRHRVTGKTYIGLSRNIERRWSKHRSQIDAIKPCKRTVGAAFDMWEDCGSMSVDEAFEFRVLCECAPDQLACFEQIYFDAFKAQGVELYNHSKAIGGLGGEGSKAVVNLDTGETYASAVAASRALGLSRMAVSNTIRQGTRAGGARWAYVGQADEARAKQRHAPGANIRRPVVNLDTGERYESGSEASRALGLEGSTVGKAIRNGSRSGGYRWAYA